MIVSHQKQLLTFRQIRLGVDDDTKGTAYIVYESVKDATVARDKLSGYNFQNRYLVVLFHSVDKMIANEEELEQRKKNLEELKRKHNID